MSSDISLILSAVRNFKTGWKTSEFWVALSPVVIGALSVLGVGVTNNSLTQTITIVWGAVAAIYVAARTFLKAVHLGHATSLAVLLKQAEQEVLHLIDDQPTNLKGQDAAIKPEEKLAALMSYETYKPVAPKLETEEEDKAAQTPVKLETAPAEKPQEAKNEGLINPAAGYPPHP